MEGHPEADVDTDAVAVTGPAISGVGQQESLARIVRLAQTVLAMPISRISVRDRLGRRLESEAGGFPRWPDASPGLSPPGEPEGGVLVVADTMLDPRLAGDPNVTGEPFVRFYASAPVFADGHRVGTICVVDRRPRAFGAHERAVLAQLAGLVESALSGPGAPRERRRPGAVNSFRRRRRAEEENSFTLLAESIADVIVAFDAAGAVVYANPAAVSLLATTEEAGLIGRNLAELVLDPPPEDLAGLLRARANGLGVRRREVTLRRPDDGTVLLDVTFGALEIDGTPVFVASGRDLTAERRVERELETLRRRTELIVTSVLEGIVLVDREGRVVYANPAAHAMLGHGPGALEGTFFHDVAHHTDADGQPYPWQRCPAHAGLRDGETYVDNRERYWRADGSPVDVAVTFAPVRDGDEVSGAVLVMSDVAKEVALERAKDEFVAIVSHELRTPLTSLKGSLGLLVAGVYGPMPSDADEMLALAVTSTDRLIRLVNNILDLQRIKAGRFPLQLAEWGVETLVRSAVSDVLPLAQARGTTIECDLHDAGLICDGDRISQVITNLLANAVKFSPEGSAVVVRASGDAAEVVIRVIDNGRGIPADRLGTIFDRFVQVDEGDARYGSGTGLGLAFAKAVVEQHAGRLGVRSDVGRGSIFTVTLPAAGPRIAAGEEPT